MDEAGEVATGGSVLEVELVLGEREAGAHRVDGHPDLHAVAASERESGAQRLDPQRPRAGDRGARLGPAEPADRPSGEAKRDTEAAADTAAEGGDGKVALPPLDRFDQRHEPSGGGAEVTVAEEDQGGRRLGAERSLRRRGHVGALAVRPATTHHLRPRRHRRLGRAVAGGVVGDPDRHPGEGGAQRRDRLSHPIGLVAGGDYRCLATSPSRRLLSRAMADIEAHITGNVWKIEVAVGDQVSDGDTVVILESMKMEIPVEAEDDGTVKEIRCEEGQAVSEGDVLVVLE